VLYYGKNTKAPRVKRDIMSNNMQQRLRKAAEVHRANIQQTTQHRLEVARASGNDKLVRQLEAEINYHN